MRLCTGASSQKQAGDAPGKPVENSRQALRPFLPFIKGIIDFIEKFDDLCVRKIFFILCMLTATPEAEDANSDGSTADDHAFDEFHILVQKHLTHESLDLKRVGILAVISAIQFKILEHRRSVIAKGGTLEEEVNWC